MQSGGSINDITNLVFYSDRGLEIPMQKSYILTWELIPDKFVSNYIHSTIKGYFIGDVDLSDPANIKIKNNTFLSNFLDGGNIVIKFDNESGEDKKHFRVFGYDEEITSEDYFNYIKSIILYSGNKINVKINIENVDYSHTYPIYLIFNMDLVDTMKEDAYSELSSDSNVNAIRKKLNSKHAIASNSNLTQSLYSEFFTLTTISTGDNTTTYTDPLSGEVKTTCEYFKYATLRKINLVKAETGFPYIQTVFENQVANLGLYFPFIRYSGDFYLDKISAGFIASNTIIVLEKGINELGEVVYQRPYIDKQNRFSLVFLPTNDSEVHIIKTDQDKRNLIFDNTASLSLSDPEPSSNSVTPLTFAIGFKASEEGAYQNFLGIYILSKDTSEQNRSFFMGLISVKTEVEGEDERFRTLLGNFGVPDPIKYPNIFTESEFDEEGKDFKLINKKSKELMLTYDLIFPYAGSYRALLKAIKFLGYSDIIFKEWYTILDSNDEYKDIAVQIFDTVSGSMLKLKLAQHGVSIEDFYRYSKINRLSMIYHLNEEDDENYEITEVVKARYDKETGEIITDGIRYPKLSEVPLTRPVYEYRSDEILAKLYAVKEWLEYNVIGVGAYISNITGEGIYFGWQKTLAYVTLHDLVDYSLELYYTPDVKSVKTFKESKSEIACTLAELNNSVLFKDYETTPISEFIKEEIPADLYTKDKEFCLKNNIIISNSIEAPLIGDEYEFTLTTTPNTGTLHEWMDNNSSNNEIYINDGEISLLFDEKGEATISDLKMLPIIRLENANIHKSYGNWRNNVEWTIKEVTDPESGNVVYKLKNIGTYNADSDYIISSTYFILKPAIEGAYIKYSEKNKWGVPVFLIHGYKFTNDLGTKRDNYNLERSDAVYVLEVLKGDMLFKECGNVAAELSFSNDNINQEQSINITYLFQSERKLFTRINTPQIFLDLHNTSSNYDDVSTQVSLDHSNIRKYYDDIVLDISTSVDGTYGDNISWEEAKNYVLSEEFLADNSTFTNKKKTLQMQSALYNNYENIYDSDNNYVCNSSINVEVNRLGKYNLISKAYDKYNNTFTNKYSKTALVVTDPLTIDIYEPNSNSNNVPTFYKGNKDGIKCSSADIKSIKSISNEIAKFPKSYRIMNYDRISDNIIEFDNISYAIDTPKNNDYIVFENLTELCTHALFSYTPDETTKLYLLDENPRKINFIATTDIHSDINICVYDPIEMKDVSMFGPYEVTEVQYVDAKDDINYGDDSYIVINSSLSKEKFVLINNPLYKTYILNATKYKLELTYDKQNATSEPWYKNWRIPQVINDYKDKSCIFRLFYRNEGELLFNVEDVVKARYEYNDASNKLDDNINEAAYRIMSVEDCEYTDETYGKISWYEYKLNGVINEQFIEYETYGINEFSEITWTTFNKNYSTYIMLAAILPTHYAARVIGDGLEYNHVIDKDRTILRDRIEFNGNQLFLEDYIDDTFSGHIYSYDKNELNRTWLDINKKLANDAELYYYDNYPVTINQDDQFIAIDNNEDGILINNYRTTWKVYNYFIDDYSNLDNFEINTGKKLLYKSANKVLSVNPNMLGTYNIELEAVDIYGNRVINPGEGKLFVNKK